MPRPRSITGLATRALAALTLAAGLGAAAMPAASADSKVTLGGGSGIVFEQGRPGSVTETSGYICTLTAVGYDRTGNLVALTNAHCFYGPDGEKLIGEKIYKDISPAGTSLNPAPLDGVRPDLETGVVGTVTHVSVPNHLLGGGPHGLDYAVIDLDETKVTPTDTVGEVTLTSIGAPPSPGTIMCKQGHRTGLTCGAMLGTSGIWFTHTIWTLGGDSGSPVAVGQTLVGNAWGLQHSTPIQSILDDMNARGGTGAGFQLA